VGDDDQSIYGWRGATLDNLKRLPVDYPQLKVIKLEQNYRSTSAILRAANNVIGPNPKLFPKTLFSELGEGEPVRVQDCRQRRARGRARRGAHPGPARRQQPAAGRGRDFAILYRANHQAKPFEKALRKANIPYKVSGGTSFFDRAEIKDLCAWFRLWINNDDDPAFLRAITTPKRGIGHTTLGQAGRICAAAQTEHVRQPVQCHAAGRPGQKVRWTACTSLAATSTTWSTARATDPGGTRPARLSDRLADRTSATSSTSTTAKTARSVAAARWSNVLEFCDWMAQRAGGQIDDTAGTTTQMETKSLLEVAQNIALLSTISERESEQDMVVLSTLHASKGLEWPHVQLVGVTEGMLPFKLDDDDGASSTSATTPPPACRKSAA
jgi:ATP-dependent DNA helicase Rep